VPTQMVIEIAPAEQARLLAEWRRARRGRGPALPILLLWALPRSPSEIASVLRCARSPVPAVAPDWQTGRCWPEPVRASGPPCFTPSLRRSLLALRKTSPATCAWCRTRWSGATLALPLAVPQRGFHVSAAETVRRCLQALDWVWKPAPRTAKDNDPEGAVKLARIRRVFERLGVREALLFAGEWELPLLPEGGRRGCLGPPPWR
jgi:hypothetical protein